MVTLDIDPMIMDRLRRRAILSDHSVEEIAEAILSQVLLDEEL